MIATRAPRALLRGALHRIPYKPALCNALRPMGLPEKVYRHLAFHGPFQVPVGAGRGFSIRHYGNAIENDLFWAGYGENWEATSLRLWLRLAARARLILDVGANTGVYALAAGAAAPEAQVIAYEPVARVHHKLVRNVMLNPFQIATHRVAISDRTGQATLFDVPGDHVYSAGLSTDVLGRRDDLVAVTVPTLRLDEAFAQPDGGLLAKIDTEGHEDRVIAGLGDLLPALRPTLLVEILEPRQGARIAAQFVGADYRFFEIRERVGVIPCDALGTAPGSEGRNYLLIPREEALALEITEGVPHVALTPREIRQ